MIRQTDKQFPLANSPCSIHHYPVKTDRYNGRGWGQAEQTEKGGKGFEEEPVSLALSEALDRWTPDKRGEQGDAVSLVEKYFSQCLRATPTSDFLYSSPFFVLPSSAGLFSGRSALFPPPPLPTPPRLYFTGEKLSSYSSYALLPRLRPCVRTYVCKRRKNNGTELASNR